MRNFKILDCTFRDGGYYNNWDFPRSVMTSYFEAMQAASVDIVELGFRSLINDRFKGPNAFTKDNYLDSFDIPSTMQVGVMVNASELVGEPNVTEKLKMLFPKGAQDSKVEIVRIACHVHEFSEALVASHWLRDQGFIVGYNLMQVADRSKAEIKRLARLSSDYSLDVLYFADSLGSMGPDRTKEIISWIQSEWGGPIGIHTHDNMGRALSNTLTAHECGALWLDSTITGMGRGPGNARTEELVIESMSIEDRNVNIVPLLKLINSYFNPLKYEYGWGSNPYYYLAGMHSIHPTYVQEMISDTRYDEEDIVAALNNLKREGGKKFSSNNLDATRTFYSEFKEGHWKPATIMSNREILILGSGPGVSQHKYALEKFIKEKDVLVLALNNQTLIADDLINLRVACHPVRLLADCESYKKMPQPLITPKNSLPKNIILGLGDKIIYDFEFIIRENTFEFYDTHAILPNSLVISYALAVAVSGGVSKIYLAGFDGYGADDPRSLEMQKMFDVFFNSGGSQIISITPTKYNINSMSVYGM